MIKLFTYLFLVSFFLTGLLKADTSPIVSNAIPTGILSVATPDFANDVIVSNVKPIGPMSGVRKPSGTIYAVINDTLLTSNLGLVIMQSSNQGITWSLFPSGINLRTKFDQVKLIKGTDSVYCYFRISNTVYRWNPDNGTVVTYAYTGIVDFDVIISSDNSIYLFLMNNINEIRRYGSSDRGFTFGTGSTLSATAVGMPRACFSKTGDTLILNYRGPLRTDFPEKSVIRSALYRQLSPGVLGFISLSFSDILTDTTISRSEFKSARYGLNVWTYYTEGTTGNQNIKYLTSTNGGLTYAAPVTAAKDTLRDNFWFDIDVYTGTSGAASTGLDFIYYSDSLQAGAPTNASDKMYYAFSTLANPTVLQPRVQFSDHPPAFSSSGTKPVIVELPSADMGALFLGMNGANQNVFWDRYSAVTRVDPIGSIIPDKFELKQNYPNPFNPQTKIVFSLTSGTYVTLKVYDIMGREVKDLVSGNFAAGSYSVDFNASALASGIYFYKLEAGSFSEVKKMNLIK